MECIICDKDMELVGYRDGEYYYQCECGHQHTMDADEQDAYLLLCAKDDAQELALGREQDRKLGI